MRDVSLRRNITIHRTLAFFGEFLCYLAAMEAAVFLMEDDTSRLAAALLAWLGSAWFTVRMLRYVNDFRVSLARYQWDLRQRAYWYGSEE